MADKEATKESWKAGRLQALTYLYAFTGMRKMEALHLCVDDIDLVRRTVRIVARTGWQPKTQKSAAVLPMAGPLAKVMMLWLPRLRRRLGFSRRSFKISLDVGHTWL